MDNALAFDIIGTVHTHWRRVFTLLLFTVSVLIALWGFLPPKVESRVVAIYPEDMALPDGSGELIPETRFLVVNWPSKIRVRDSGVIRLALEFEPPLVNTPPTQRESQSSETPLQNVYDTHDVVAEARLELDDVEFFPVGQISEGLLPGKPVKFFWRLRPNHSGKFEGTAWLHLRFMPEDGGPEMRSVLTAQVVEIQATSFIGLNGVTARVFGSVCFVVAVAMVLDELISYFIGKRSEQIKK